MWAAPVPLARILLERFFMRAYFLLLLMCGATALTGAVGAACSGPAKQGESGPEGDASDANTDTGLRADSGEAGSDFEAGGDSEAGSGLTQCPDPSLVHPGGVCPLGAAYCASHDTAVCGGTLSCDCLMGGGEGWMCQGSVADPGCESRCPPPDKVAVGRNCTGQMPRFCLGQGGLVCNCTTGDYFACSAPACPDPSLLADGGACDSGSAQDCPGAVHACAEEDAGFPDFYACSNGQWTLAEKGASQCPQDAGSD